jgi:hypothetical protein
MTAKTFYEIHFTGEGFRTLGVSRLFFARALAQALKVRADYDAEVADWYENGEGRSPNWIVEHDAEGWPHNVNIGGSGYRFPHCIHGTSLWTDYDNICGGCEDGSTAIEDAIVSAREAFLRFNARWDWVHSAPGDLDHDTRRELLDWATSLFPKGD